MYLWKVWISNLEGEKCVVTDNKKIFEVVEVLDENGFDEPKSISFVTEVIASELKLEEWKEMFYLLKSDHEKLENFQTEEWKEKYRKLVGEIQ